MTHDEIVGEIQRRAKLRGIRTHYCGSSIRCTGDKGKPDLFIVGPFGSAWLEVKTAGDDLRPDQTTWRHMLIAAGQVHYVIGEAQLNDGAVDALLRFVATGEAA